MKAGTSNAGTFSAGLLLSALTTGSVLAGGVAASAAPGVPIQGDWRGQVVDSPAEEIGPYRTDVHVDRTLTRGEKGGTIDYAKYDCGGKLIFRRESHGSYVFREHHTYGRRSCNEGTVRLTPRADGRLQFLWTDPHDPAYTAEGVLRTR